MVRLVPSLSPPPPPAFGAAAAPAFGQPAAPAGAFGAQPAATGAFGAPSAGTCVCFCVSLRAIGDTFSMLICVCTIVLAHTCKRTHVYSRTPLTREVPQEGLG